MPLHAAWAGWLWERALRCGEATELDSYGMAAYRCVLDVAALTADVQAGIRCGNLVVPAAAEGNAGLTTPN